MFHAAELFGQNVRFFLTEPRRFPAAAGLPRPEASSGTPRRLALSSWSVFFARIWSVPSPRRLLIVAIEATIRFMMTVGIRELKNRLSEHLRMIRDGEEILVTDRGKVVAELRQPPTCPGASAHPHWRGTLVPDGRASARRTGRNCIPP